MRKNFCKLFPMREIFSKVDVNLDKLKANVWQDEVSDLFILTKNMELYLSGEEILTGICWNRITKFKIQKLQGISNEKETDDTLYVFNSDLRNLPQLLLLGHVFRQRPDRFGNWILGKEKLLGHKLIKFHYPRSL